MRKIFMNIVLYVAISATGFFSFAGMVAAAPPTSPYAPGETLAPSCAPGASNCTVSTTTVGGSNTQVQFNDAGGFGGDSAFTFNKLLSRLTTTYASTTAFTATNAFLTNISATNLNLGNSTGLLQTAAGAVSASSTLSTVYGGTGVSSLPAYGQILVGNGGGGYTLTATSSLGLSGVGTITSGTLNQLAYYSGATTISGIATSSLGVALSDTTGTLGVSSGGTGSTSFGQGWIYSTGGTGVLNASTSPTVDHIVATSTTATSTFAHGIDIIGGCLSINSICVVGGSGASLSAANVWTALQQFSANSSSTQQSVYSKAYFGGTATTTIDSAGVLTLAGSITGPLQAVLGAVSATTSLSVVYGGTGLTSAPSYGQIPVGNSSGGYTLTATSSLGLAGGVTGTINSGTINQLAYYAAGGTTISGISTSSLGIALTDTTGTLGVSRGGTGSTSFGQGWIYSSGGTGTLSASTSPTVNYIVATSTTATSTFANGIDIRGGCLSISGICVVGGSGASLSAANVWTALQQFQGGASSTQISSYGNSYFGGTATSTFSSSGTLTLAGITSGILQAISGAVSASSTVSTTYGGTGTSSAFTVGSVIFAGTGGNYNQNNSNLFWDNTNGRLGIASTSPNERLVVTGTIGSQHLKGIGAPPSVSVGSGAGTGASGSVTGTDIAGTITINTGTLPASGAGVFTLTFAASYATSPYVIFVPANAATSLLSGASMVILSASTGSFSLTSGSTGLIGSTAYAWNYVVIQ